MKHSQSSLFLMELIISILFFSLASTVCIQLFSKSHLLSQSTVEENHAVIQAQNMAELFLACDGELPRMADYSGELEYSPATDTVTLYFDNDWSDCSPESAAYIASLRIQETDLTEQNVQAQIQISRVANAPEESIYTLFLEHHTAKRRCQID